MLLENTMFGRVDKVKTAIDRLKMFEPEDGYCLAFSGGKDSVVIKALAEMSGVKYKAHFSLTTVDPPELVSFVRNFNDVKIMYPEKSMWKLIIEKGVPPTRAVRYCCQYLKEDKGEGKTVITGVRWSESSSRRKWRGRAEIQAAKKRDSIILNNDNDKARRVMENCTIKGKRVVNPIVEWTTEDVWEFIKGYGVRYCSLYDEGFERIGCIGCPLASKKAREINFSRWPKYKTAYIRTFERAIQKRIDRGLPNRNQTAEELFAWWMEDKYKEIDGQIEMAEQWR